MSIGDVILALVAAFGCSLLPVLLITQLLHIESDKGQKIVWGIVVIAIAGAFLIPQYQDYQVEKIKAAGVKKGYYDTTNRQIAETPSPTNTPIPHVNVQTSQDRLTKETFTPEGMYKRMTDHPDGIKATGYVKEWKKFGIQFKQNPDRIYIYSDFPEDRYEKLLESDNPYAYYNSKIKGHYPAATKYYLKDLDL